MWILLNILQENPYLPSSMGSLSYHVDRFNLTAILRVFAKLQ